MAHLDLHDPANTVLLAGSGRSGTTWLGQIINADHQYREVFEPLFPERVRRVAEFPTTRYIPVNDTDASLAALIGGLLEGRVRSRWTDRYNRRFLARRRLTKVIRANLMLGYIRRRFPHVKLCFALRHPCAVATSRLKLGWAPHLHELLGQPALVSDHLVHQRELIERVLQDGDLFDQHITMWCIENVVPLRELKAGDVCVLQYERFCNAFDPQAEGLFNWLGRPAPRRIGEAAKRVSAHYRRDSAVLTGASPISGWRQHVSAGQLDRALKLLDAFGLNHLYGAENLPLCEPAKVFIEHDRPARSGKANREAA
ncbi:MAG: sulfotransferase [Planctomycetota bacterium]